MSQPSTQDLQIQPVPSSNQQQAYVPPNQHGPSDPQGIPSGPLTPEQQIKQIDQELSSDWYSRYNRWLYVKLVSGVTLGILLLSIGKLNGKITPTIFLYALHSFAMAYYALNMIGALKDKEDFWKARMGYDGARAFFLTFVVTGSINVLVPMKMQEIVIFYAVQLPPMMIFWYFVIYKPAAKIFGLLQKRLAFWQQAHNINNA